jgi:outer membrane protein W
MFKKLAFSLTLLTSANAYSNSYYTSIFGGISHINSKTFKNSNVTSLDFDKGFVSGIAIGHNINSTWSTEISWSYTSNEHKGVSTGNFAGMDGNYASNLFHLTGYYHLNPIQKFKPFLGLSMIVAQEVDLDFENSSTESSYSSGGKIGYALTVGSEYLISDKYSIFGNIVYNNIGKMNLVSENGLDRLQGIKYNPIYVNVGLKYNF